MRAAKQPARVEWVKERLSMTLQHSGRTRPMSWVVLLGIIGLMLAIGLGFYFARRPASPDRRPLPDPLREYTGPFLNVSHEVAYVPESRCAECHEKESRAFAEHAMGRSLMPVAQAPAPPQEPAYHNPFDALGFQFQV